MDILFKLIEFLIAYGAVGLSWFVAAIGAWLIIVEGVSKNNNKIGIITGCLLLMLSFGFWFLAHVISSYELKHDMVKYCITQVSKNDRDGGLVVHNHPCADPSKASDHRFAYNDQNIIVLGKCELCGKSNSIWCQVTGKSSKENREIKGWVNTKYLVEQESKGVCGEPPP